MQKAHQKGRGDGIDEQVSKGDKRGRGAAKTVMPLTQIIFMSIFP